MPNNSSNDLDSSVERRLTRVNYFHSNPLDLTNKTFKSKSDVYISDPSIDLKVVIESYLKSIGNTTKSFPKLKKSELVNLIFFFL